MKSQIENAKEDGMRRKRWREDDGFKSQIANAEEGSIGRVLRKIEQ